MEQGLYAVLLLKTGIALSLSTICQILSREKNSLIPITQKEFKMLAAYIESQYGIHLKDEKKSLVMGRLQNELLKNNFKTFEQYYQYVISDKTGAAANKLIERISTNHTFFLREKEHFTYFANSVLPYLADHTRDRDLRIWSAGCSTGQEPYTLAMIIQDFVNNRDCWDDTRILATDISERVLKQARQGIYTKDSVEALPSFWKLNYLKKIDADHVQLTDQILDQVIFKKFNLMTPRFPFKRKFHVIFCRNVMIYFNKETRLKLVKKFYDMTEPGGYLFIGQSESINRNETDYQYVMPAVYRKL